MIRFGLNTSRGLVNVNFSDATDRDIQDAVFASSSLQEDIASLKELAVFRNWSVSEREGKKGKYWVASAEKKATSVVDMQARLSLLKK